MKLKRSRQARRGKIEIIPMIDVMFFLLATFMLASLSMQRLDSMKIDLPVGQAQQLSLDTPLTLTVTRANAIFVNRQAVPLAALAGALRPLLKPDGNLVVAADDAASHGVVVKAMLEARKAGAQHFLIAVHHE
ncbi:Tol-Pal system protein TolR [Paraburkholderia kirstenboschensis]|uniref:ExbD/TolR family protein n=2 Tax=Paraburkholderia kirstenboschensis TaxID=1245436 RepID=UPI000B0AC6E6|nr:biopolymer transporter ExbD [Paraburkholderia kirstenboschensis]CAD6557258.1 Tol-Pal system protein TolR [Paraburkholderia kirstenboschensis]